MAILNGWKEVAAYFNRGVRTVQRWEEYGLPVRRPGGHIRAAVVTTTEELDRWLAKTPPALRDAELGNLRLRAEVALHRHRSTVHDVAAAARKMQNIARAYGVS